MGFYRSIYSVAQDAAERGLVLYGAGCWGELAVRIFSLFHVCPACFCDDDPEKQGTYFQHEGSLIPILSLADAARQMPDAVYIATVSSNSTVRIAMNRRLEELGLLSENSGFHPMRYLFLLEGGLEALRTEERIDQNAFLPEYIDHLIVFNPISPSSGMVLCHTLMDGHPNILNIMYFGLWSDIKRVYLERLQYLEDEALVVETACQMAPFFSTVFPEDLFAGARWWAGDFLNNEGEIQQSVFMAPDQFVSALWQILKGRGKVSFAVLFKAIFSAYQNVRGKKYVPGQEYWILYERHRMDYDVGEFDQLLHPGDFERVEYWFTIREPVQRLFSQLSREKENSGMALEYWRRILAAFLGAALERSERSKDKVLKAIRFEDLKTKTRETMQSVCQWMGIAFDDCMLETTAYGVPVSFPAGSGDQKKVISTYDKTALNRRNFSSLMSEYDIFRLNLVCQTFKRVYGYECDVPDYALFSEALREELYQHPFRFEPIIDSLLQTAGKRSGLPDGQLDAHSCITERFLAYMRGEHEYAAELISPLEEAANE